MTTFEGLEKPWGLALAYLSEFEWHPVMFGIGYIGWGRVRKENGAAFANDSARR